MAEEKTIRLNKVMKEFNLGFNTISDYLEGKGVGVSNPNDKISDNAYQLVAKEFGSDLLVKEQAKNVEFKTLKDAVSKKIPKKGLPANAIAAIKKAAPAPAPKKTEPPKPPVEVSVVSRIELPPSERALKRHREKERREQEKAQRTAQAKATLTALLPKKQDKRISETPPPAPAPEEIKTEAPSIEAPRVLGKLDDTLLNADTRSSQKNKTQRRAEKRRARRERDRAAKKEAAVSGAAMRASAREKLGAIALGGKKSRDYDTPDQPQSPQEEFIPIQTDTILGPKVQGKVDLAAIKDNKPDRDSPQRGKRKRIKTTAAVNIDKENKNNRHSRKPDRGHPKPRRRAPVISEEAVDKQMKETLAKMMEKGIKTKTSKYRREKRDAVSEKLQAERALQNEGFKTIELAEFVTANDLSKMMDVPVNNIIGACMNLGLMVSLNQRLDAEAIALIVENFGYRASFVAPDTQSILNDEVDRPEDLVQRAPIVTVMGHVDHGKTSLIDNIRKTNIIAGEAGGITQHIGAYHVDLPSGRQITFLDTPGHEAFTAMRARGAQATDIAIIIIAADDSVMPQTTEAINHAVAAGVPMIFAINKIDKQGADPDKIRTQLADMNYLVEDWGGKYQVQEIAAKSGVNVEKLLEKILVETDLLELKANPSRRAQGVVIESLLDKGRGYISRVLVQNGTLRTGDIILSGQHVGKIKAMFNERGKKIAAAGPSIPVEILGLNGATTAGDTFGAIEDEREARSIASQREQLQRIQGLRTQKHITLDEIGRRLAIGNFKELNIIVKADVDGSAEALTGSLLQLSTEQVQVNVIHKAVGAISDSDVQLAAAAEAIIVGFQVRPSSSVRKSAEQEGIEIRTYSIIYDAINEIKDAIAGMHMPEYAEKIVCTVEILQVYHISKVGSVAGCIVREGKITRQTKVRVIRAGIVIHTGKLDSLKRFKDDIKEVSMGFECGLNIANFNDIEAGDIIEGYEMEEVK